MLQCGQNYTPQCSTAHRVRGILIYVWIYVYSINLSFYLACSILPTSQVAETAVTVYIQSISEKGVAQVEIQFCVHVEMQLFVIPHNLSVK